MSPPATPNSADYPNPVRASAATLKLLDDLHTKSLEQEAKIDLTQVPKDEFKEALSDKFIALDQNKCQFVYQLLKAMRAQTVVEAGTSYGVSTIYLALAVNDNTGGKGTVIATEHELAKAEQARKYWSQCEEDIQKVIDLREGDLLETLKTLSKEVDLLLLDIWAPMAFPTLKLVEPSFRSGSVIILDNSIKSAKRYEELLSYIRSNKAYQSLCVPYYAGLEFVTYNP